MSNTHETKITRDDSGRKLLITRDFSAPLAKVWRAWTESELLDQWWAPKPYRAQTKSIRFETGGRWLYAMVGPEGDKHWCRVDIEEVVKEKSFQAVAGFCDENGVLVDTAPPMHWFARFSATDTGSRLDLEMRFNSETDLETIVQMGFKEGFTMALGNLDELLAA
ncbi:SRPBCC family protein [Sediminibacterium soli]|uniref:SRPBCC family protein n=1 Tax=Sediminibacterium soli TaxID=2698829 RepID=UPI00137A2935|nr:SRPBCC domain-containing protein [Sediminibacterium soli]NCI46534.1 SRPBCC domain-containing protein [Sediminibacterium soli]